MAIRDIPTIITSNTAASYYDGTGTSTTSGGWVNTATSAPVTLATTRVLPMAQAINQMRPETIRVPMENKMAKNTLRIVKVIIADTDENIPLEKRVLYSGEEKLTDATDQELFFEIDIKGILDKHNEYRVTLKDKSVKERVENLEPVKIRDLRMVVVNVATF